jgi:hypothetical protein
MGVDERNGGDDRRNGEILKEKGRNDRGILGGREDGGHPAPGICKGMEG